MEQIQYLTKKLRVSPQAKRKAMEYLRLAEVKCPPDLPPSCLAAICIEIACDQQGDLIDRSDIQKYSSVQAKKYTSSLQTVRKVLQVDPQGSLHSLSVRLGCSETKNNASNILKSYEEYLLTVHTEAHLKAMDITKPLYKAAALYAACRLMKVRCNKEQFIAVTHSNKKLFDRTVETMIERAPKTIVPLAKERKGHQKKEIIIQDDDDGDDEMQTDSNPYPDVPEHLVSDSWSGRCLFNPTSETFVEWKAQMMANTKAPP